MFTKVVKMNRKGQSFKRLLRALGCPTKAADEIWKWYDSSEKKGAASF